MTQPLVSIIVPTYNGEKRIARTLESLIAQDYANLEIIVVDDVSTDNTVIAARNVLEASGRKYLIIERTENGRQSASRNTGLKAASGKYVMFFDHDDLAEREFVSMLCSKAESGNMDITFCSFRHYYEHEDRYEAEHFPFHEGVISSEHFLKLWASRKINPYSIWNYIYRKNFLDEHNLHFTDSCYFGEDTEFILKVLACAPSMSFIKREAFTYIHHAEQQSNANAFFRKGQNWYHQLRLTCLRTGRFIARRTHNRKVRDYALNFYIPDSIIKQFTVYANHDDKDSYSKFLKMLKHKKTKELLLSTVKFLFSMPEVFIKSLMLLYTPKLYYYLRKGRAK